MSFGSRRGGGDQSKVMWAMILRHDKEVKELRQRIAVLEMQEYPLWILPEGEKVRLGMVGLFPR